MGQLALTEIAESAHRQSYAALLCAAAAHALAIWFLLPALIDRSEPDMEDIVEIALRAPLVQPPSKPDLPRTEEAAKRLQLPALPQLARIAAQPLSLDIPLPIAPNPPMTLPAATAPIATESPAAMPNDPRIASALANAGKFIGSSSYSSYFGRVRRHIDAHKREMTLQSEAPARGSDIVLILDVDGSVLNAGIIEGSGNPSFDEQAVQQLFGMGRFPKPPESLKPPVAIILRWRPPIVFSRAVRMNEIGAGTEVCVNRSGPSGCYTNR